tara:strand:- start:1497 stop:1886 length:390 start_codon:yes stop_codon:yes gene_type:complete
MANITNIIGGQPYLDAATGNMKNKLLNFWKGTQAEYDALKQTAATTASNPGAASTVDFTVTSSSAFTVGDIVYVTGTAPGNTTRTQGTVDSLPDATSIVVAFAPAYTSASSTGYQIDLYDPKTLYIITA